MLRITTLFMALMAFSFNLLAQDSLIFSTGGSFGDTLNKVNFYTYHPSNSGPVVQDSILGDFSNDVAYSENYNLAFFHVGRSSSHSLGGDAIYVYDGVTFTVLDSIKPVTGLQSMELDGKKLIITKGYGAGSNYVEIYDITNLAGGPIYSDTQIGTQTSGVTVMGDSAYVSFTRNDTGHIATIDISGATPTFGNEHSFDTLSSGLGQLMNDGQKVVGLSEKYDMSFTFQYAGVTTFDPSNGTYATDTNASGASAGIMLRNDSLFAKLGSPVNIYDLSNNTTSQLFSHSYSDGVWDPTSDRYYLQKTDFFSNGELYVLDKNGNGIDTFQTDISGSAIEMIERGATSITEEASPKPRLKLYPNPAKGSLWVDLSENAKKVDRVRIMDLTGRVLMEKGSFQGERSRVDVSELPSGVYYMTLEVNDERITKKWIKQ